MAPAATRVVAKVAGGLDPEQAASSMRRAIQRAGSQSA